MTWLPLLLLSLILLLLFVPVTPLRLRLPLSLSFLERFQNTPDCPVNEPMSEPPEDAPAPGLMMNGPKEAEDLHRRDVSERLAKYFEPKLPEDDLVFE